MIQVICVGLQQTGVAATGDIFEKRTDCNFSGVIQLKWWQGRPFGRVNEDCLHEEGGHKES